MPWGPDNVSRGPRRLRAVATRSAKFPFRRLWRLCLQTLSPHCRPPGRRPPHHRRRRLYRRGDPRCHPLHLQPLRRPLHRHHHQRVHTGDRRHRQQRRPRRDCALRSWRTPERRRSLRAPPPWPPPTGPCRPVRRAPFPPPTLPRSRGTRPPATGEARGSRSPPRPLSRACRARAAEAALGLAAPSGRTAARKTLWTPQPRV